jgi:hypothetical protein
MQDRFTTFDRTLITACALVYIYLVVLGIGAIWGGCHDPNSQDYSYHHSNYDDCAANGVGHFFLAVLTSIDRWNTAFTAISTFFIAVFTVVLALVTGRQARLTKLSADAAAVSQGQRVTALTLYLIWNAPIFLSKSIPTLSGT